MADMYRLGCIGVRLLSDELVRSDYLVVLNHKTSTLLRDINASEFRPYCMQYFTIPPASTVRYLSAVILEG